MNEENRARSIDSNHRSQMRSKPKAYPLLYQSSNMVNQKQEHKRIMQENVKMANAMIKMKSTYDIQSYKKDYSENLSKYRKLI